MVMSALLILVWKLSFYKVPAVLILTKNHFSISSSTLACTILVKNKPKCTNFMISEIHTYIHKYTDILIIVGYWDGWIYWKVSLYWDDEVIIGFS